MGDVAVIGAGIAGLAAAGELAARGLRPVVFDKGRGPGGRVSTRRAGTFSFDHGAQYFTAREREFRARVDAWLAAGAVARWDARIVAFENGTRRASSDPIARYVGTPEMNALPKHLARGLDVRCSLRVARAEFRERRWLLRDENEAPLGEFDALIATLPHAQFVDLLGSASPLSARAATSVVEPCWAVLAGFAARLDTDFDAAFCNAPALSWIARNSSKPGRSTAESWVLHATPAWTRAHLEEPKELVAAALLREFEHLTGLRLPAPAHLDAHRWRYALPAPVATPEPAWLDPEHQLALAGDACVGGRVEGAFTSGLAAARALFAQR